MKNKKILAFFLCILVILCQIASVNISLAENVGKTQTTRQEQQDNQEDSFYVEQEKDSVNTVMPMRDLTSEEIVKEMGTGWNLGNTMDGHNDYTPGETVWQHVVTTKQLLKNVHDMGFNTVRIPVTWGTKINEKKEYQLDSAWLNRVQDIVDYAIAQDMYVIINVHHDGASKTGWLRVDHDNRNFSQVCKKFQKVWEQIAFKFQGYDEHLIFESMNEVKGNSTEMEDIYGDVQHINQLNQIFVDTVRQSGGNNDMRWLSVPGWHTDIDITTDSKYNFQMPSDTVENKLFLSVHQYVSGFSWENAADITEFNEENANEVVEQLSKLKQDFLSRGIPVILGEYGAVNKNNSPERAYYYEVVNRACANMGIVPVAWDQGWYDHTRTPDYSFTLIDRNTGQSIDKEITNAIMRGYYYQDISSGNLLYVDKQMNVVPFSDIGISQKTVMLTVGNVEEVVDFAGDVEGKGDVILWKSDREDIATVHNGRIHGKGVGIASVTAFSQEGQASETIQVYVMADGESNSCTNIMDNVGENESLTIKYGESFYLCAVAQGDGTNSLVSYSSSDEEVITVSQMGKIVATGVGNAFVVETAATGRTKVIPVTVTGKEKEKEIYLSLNLRIQDNKHNYAGNEYSQPIKVTGDGTYTLVFDCKKDYSKEAKKAGLNYIQNMVSMSVKDYQMIKRERVKSPVEHCQISIDKVETDGGEKLKLTDKEARNALKAESLFDADFIVNAKKDSLLKDVVLSKDENTVNIKGKNKIKKIKVTFTLSGLQFTSYGENITAVFPEPEISQERIVLGDVGDKTTITVEHSSKAAVSTGSATDTEDSEWLEDSPVVFVSEDVSVAYIDIRKENMKQGQAVGEIAALGIGDTKVKAYNANGVYTECEVTVSPGNKEKGEEDFQEKESQQIQQGTNIANDRVGLQNPGAVTAVCIMIIIFSLGALFVFYRK